MKFRSREINVFSISALDLFASALGAFILISIVLMPYFLRTDPDEVARLRKNLAQAQAAEAATQQRLAQAQAAAAETGERLQQCQRQEASCRQEVEGLRQGAADLQRCRSELEVCTAKLAKTFLAIVIQWPTVRHDVDLHIFDASGREYFWDKKRYSGHSGELSVDTTCGPGVEIWEIADAPVGEYRVYYNLFDRHGNGAPAVVNGGVYHREGHNPFRKTALTNPGTAQLVAKVTVKNDGNVEVSQSSRDVINRPHRDSTECHRPSQRR